MQCRARTHDAKIKTHMRFLLSQTGAPGCIVLILKIVIKGFFRVVLGNSKHDHVCFYLCLALTVSITSVIGSVVGEEIIVNHTHTPIHTQNTAVGQINNLCSLY